MNKEESKIDMEQVYQIVKSYLSQYVNHRLSPFIIENLSLHIKETIGFLIDRKIERINQFD